MHRPCIAFVIVAALAAGFVPAAEESAPVRVAVTVPNGGWKLKIGQVYEVGEEIWVLAQVRHRGGVAAQVISRLEATAPVSPAPGRKVRTFVGGATWNCRNPAAGAVEFVDDLEAVRTKAKEAGSTLLHEAPAEPPPRAVYIVTFREELFENGVTAAGASLEDLARKRVAEVDGELKAVSGIIHGFSAVLTPAAAERLRRMPEVAAVEQDGPVAP